MTLPRQNSAWVDGDGRPTRDLYNWARQITIQPQTGVASSYALGDLTNVSLSGISDGDVLTWSNTQGRWINSAPSGSSGGYSEGTAFPSSPTTGQKFYRTDLNWLCFYDGTRWLTCHEYSADLANQQAFQPYTAGTINFGSAPARRDFGVFLTRLYGTYYVGGANGVSDYWTLEFRWGDAASSETTLNTTNSKSVAGSTNISWAVSINSTLSSSAFYLAVYALRTGTPGGLYGNFSIAYRLIVT